VVKENANFCDWFRPNPGAFSGERPEKSSAASEKLNALFQEEFREEFQDETASEHGEPTDGEPAESENSKDPVRSRLEDLFSKD
jgi:hypothetical protein